jgi:hypothetical protein
MKIFGKPPESTFFPDREKGGEKAEASAVFFRLEAFRRPFQDEFSHSSPKRQTSLRRFTKDRKPRR